MILTPVDSAKTDKDHVFIEEIRESLSIKAQQLDCLLDFSCLTNLQALRDIQEYREKKYIEEMQRELRNRFEEWQVEGR